MSLIQIEHLYFTYDGGSEPVFEDLDLQLETDWKLGLVGRNGRGKTTLLRLLEGGLEHRGQIRTGGLACRRFPCAVRETEVPVSQVLRDISPEAEEWQLVRELSLLGLDEEVLERTLSTLSGGEQTRVLLSALFLDEGSWPMLDEPTDHLDEEGRELLAQYLKGICLEFDFHFTSQIGFFKEAERIPVLDRIVCLPFFSSKNYII